jgi:hypothetical protein
LQNLLSGGEKKCSDCQRIVAGSLCHHCKLGGGSASIPGTTVYQWIMPCVPSQAPGAGQPSLLRTIYEPPPSAVRLVQQTSSVRPASAAPVRSDRSWRTSETRLAAGNPHASPLQQNNRPGTSPASAASGRSDVPDIFLRVGDASPLTAGMIGTPGPSNVHGIHRVSTVSGNRLRVSEDRRESTERRSNRPASLRTGRGAAGGKASWKEGEIGILSSGVLRLDVLAFSPSHRGRSGVGRSSDGHDEHSRIVLPPETGEHPSVAPHSRQA